MIVPLTEKINDFFADSFTFALLNPPDVDRKFIENYNFFARFFKNFGSFYKDFSGFFPNNFNDAFSRYYDSLGTEIDTEKDIWEGLDYEVMSENIGKKNDKLLLVRNENSDRHIYFSPPEAGHNSGVIHFKNSLDKSVALNALQYANLWIMDKGNAEEEDSDFGLDDCVERSKSAIEYINNHTGEKVDVAGFCQGGWEVFLASYLIQDKCSSCASGASPYNWHSSDLSDLTREINPADKKDSEKVKKQRDRIENLISQNKGIMPGLWNLLGFIYFSKDQLLHKDMDDLFRASFNSDNEYIQRFKDFRPGWFMHPQGLGGRYFKEVFSMYEENGVFQSSLKILGKEIDLRKFKLPIYCLNGTKDNITSYGQQMDLFKNIGTVSKDKVEDSVKAGHIGVFTSSKAMPCWNAWFETITHPDFSKTSFSPGEFYKSLR